MIFPNFTGADNINMLPMFEYEILMKWKLASNDYLNQHQPDLRLLEMDYIPEFTKPDAVENAVDQGDMITCRSFTEMPTQSGYLGI